MKFIFLAPRFHTNQISWVEALFEHGHEIEVNVLFKGCTENYSLVDPTVFSPCKTSKIVMNLFGTGGVNLYRGFPNPIYYFKSLMKSKADVIVVRDIGRWFSLLGAICARILGIKIIIYSQTSLHKNYSFKRKMAMKCLFKIFKAKWITPVLGDNSQEFIVPKKIFFVPFAVEIANKKKEILDSCIRFLSIGKFEKRKNQLLLLKVIKSLVSLKKSFSLTIIGEVSNKQHTQSLEKCQRFIKKNNLQGRVKIYTNIPNEQIKKFYLDHDVFILPATEEPAAISPLEAMGYGLPAICSNTNGTRFYIEHNSTGIIFKDNSFKSLKGSIKSLINKSEVLRMQENVRAFSKKNLSKNNFYDCFLNIL